MAAAAGESKQVAVSKPHVFETVECLKTLIDFNPSMTDPCLGPSSAVLLKTKGQLVNQKTIYVTTLKTVNPREGWPDAFDRLEVFEDSLAVEQVHAKWLDKILSKLFNGSKYFTAAGTPVVPEPQYMAMLPEGFKDKDAKSRKNAKSRVRQIAQKPKLTTVRFSPTTIFVFAPKTMVVGFARNGATQEPQPYDMTEGEWLPAVIMRSSRNCLVKIEDGSEMGIDVLVPCTKIWSVGNDKIPSPAPADFVQKWPFASDVLAYCGSQGELEASHQKFKQAILNGTLVSNHFSARGEPCHKFGKGSTAGDPGPLTKEEADAD
jgi:hypothetical protein